MRISMVHVGLALIPEAPPYAVRLRQRAPVELS